MIPLKAHSCRGAGVFERVDDVMRQGLFSRMPAYNGFGLILTILRSRFQWDSYIHERNLFNIGLLSQEGVH